MNVYLSDTDTLIDFSKDFYPTKTRLLSIFEKKDIVGISSINIAEFYTGVPPKQHEQWKEFLEMFTYWNISKETALQAGIYRNHFLRKGKQLTVTDALVAAVAKEHGATIITTNFKDYPMKDVNLLSLRN